MALGTQKNYGSNLIIDKVDYKLYGNYWDSNKLFDVLNGRPESHKVHLGLLSLFNQQRLVSTPILNITKDSVITVPGDEAEVRYSVPYTLAAPTIIEDLTGDNQRVGIDESVFEVIIGNGSLDPVFQVHHIIATDRRNGQNFEVVEVGSRVGEGHIFKLKLITFEKEQYVDKAQLAVGTPYFPIGSTIGKYDEVAPGISQGFGKMDMMQRLGSKRAVYAKIHGSAQKFRLEDANGLSPETLGAMEQYLDVNSKDFFMAVGTNDGKGGFKKEAGVGFATMIETLLFKELHKQIEESLTWGQAGQLQDQRNTHKYVAAGLYQQMKKGTHLKVARWSKGVLADVFSAVYRNRPDIPAKERYLHFQVGRGAYDEITTILAAEGARIANTLGAVIDNSSVGVLAGKAMDLTAGYEFTKVYFPGNGWVTIEHLPALDVTYGRYQDEMVGRYPKQSYTALIFDVTDGKSTNAFKLSPNIKFSEGFNKNKNLFLIKDEDLQGIKTTYRNGRTSPYAQSAGRGTIASSLFDGFEIFMEEKSSLLLADPGRAVIVELK